MRIFFVCLRVPYPPDRGDRITTFNEIRHLARDHDVHVFCLSDGAEDAESIAALGAYARSVTAVTHHAMVGKLRAARALVTGEPLSVAVFDEPALHRAIRAKHAELRPDMIMVYSCNMAQFAEPFTETPRLMQFADLDSLKWEQYAAVVRPPMSWIYRLEKTRLLAYERHIGSTFSHALVCTAVEKRDFERLLPGVSASLVSNGVDLDYFKPQGGAKKPGSMIFTGVMDYMPNVDAVTWFCDAILPLVRERVSDASLVICGSRPTASVRALGTRPGVAVTGRVPDVRPYLDSADVGVISIRIARGIQNKLLEAMAMGLPCVTTTPSWQGTMVPDGDGLLVADQAGDFADHVVRLLTDAGYRGTMARKARAVAESYFSWDAQMSLLDEVVRGITGGDIGRRRERSAGSA